MGILNSDIGEPRSKTLRYSISGIALAAMLAGTMWYFLRFTSEKHTVARFMDAVIAGNTQQAYQIWQPHPSFTYQDFLGFWGPAGYYSPIKSYRIESAEVPPGSTSGVIVGIEFSKYAPFPSSDDAVKTGENREVHLWVERTDQSLSFPPP